jgi:hypothetical protein
MTWKIVALGFAAVLLSACTAHQMNARHYIEQFGVVDPTPTSFKICYSHDCQDLADVQLSPDQWERVRAVFSTGAADAAAEREYISRAIGVLETMVGPRTGTDRDIGGSFRGSLLENQMDCVDEAVNTLTYLTIMEDDQLISYHDINLPASRGIFLNGWPHIAAVLVDKHTKEKYVVDSWFLDNGQPAFVLPYKKRKSGWNPERNWEISETEWR